MSSWDTLAYRDEACLLRTFWDCLSVIVSCRNLGLRKDGIEMNYSVLHCSRASAKADTVANNSASTTSKASYHLHSNLGSSNSGSWLGRFKPKKYDHFILHMHDFPHKKHDLKSIHVKSLFMPVKQLCRRQSTADKLRRCC